MTDAPYFKPHEEGPLFPDDASRMGDDVDTFLAAYNRDVSVEVVGANIQDLTYASLKKFAASVVAEYFERLNERMRRLVEILADLGAANGFDDDTLRELSGLPFEEAFADAYRFLCQTGLDPDKVLAEFIQTEKD